MDTDQAVEPGHQDTADHTDECREAALKEQQLLHKMRQSLINLLPHEGERYLDVNAIRLYTEPFLRAAINQIKTFLHEDEFKKLTQGLPSFYHEESQLLTHLPTTQDLSVVTREIIGLQGTIHQFVILRLRYEPVSSAQDEDQLQFTSRTRQYNSLLDRYRLLADSFTQFQEDVHNITPQPEVSALQELNNSKKTLAYTQSQLDQVTEKYKILQRKEDFPSYLQQNCCLTHFREVSASHQATINSLTTELQAARLANVDKVDLHHTIRQQDVQLGMGRQREQSQALTITDLTQKLHLALISVRPMSESRSRKRSYPPSELIVPVPKDQPTQSTHQPERSAQLDQHQRSPSTLRSQFWSNDRLEKIQTFKLVRHDLDQDEAAKRQDYLHTIFALRDSLELQMTEYIDKMSWGRTTEEIGPIFTRLLKVVSIPRSRKELAVAMSNLLNGKSMSEQAYSKTFKFPFSVDASRRDWSLILSPQGQLGRDATWFILAFFVPEFYKALSITFHMSHKSGHKDLHKRAFHPYASYNRKEIATAQLAYFLAIYTTDLEGKHFNSSLPISTENHEDLHSHLGDTKNMRRIARLTQPPHSLFQSLTSPEEGQDSLLSFIKQRRVEKLHFQQERGWTQP